LNCCGSFDQQSGFQRNPLARIQKVGRSHIGERVVGYEPFATGWLKADGKVTGRPVDLLMLADGSMLVSDDFAGSIYRISYALGH